MDALALLLALSLGIDPAAAQRCHDLGYRGAVLDHRDRVVCVEPETDHALALEWRRDPAQFSDAVRDTCEALDLDLPSCRR